MAYYAYEAGRCENCGASLGLIYQNGGRNRRYCNARCRQAAYRRRRAERDNANNVTETVLRYSHLVNEWHARFGDQVGDLLTNILDRHGVDAARDAAGVADVVVVEMQRRLRR